ncbi:MAG: beta-propeller fold lactonase family protein [Acidobacteriota bacterium]
MRDIVRSIVCLLVFALPVSAAQPKSGTIAVTGDGRFVLTANPDSRSVSVVDAERRAVVAEVKVNGTPQTVCVAPDGGRAYVPTREGSLAVIDIAPPRLVQSIGIGGGELFGAVCDGARLYVSASGASRILVFDRATLQQTGSVVTEEFPRGLAVAGGKLYVTHFRSGKLSVIDTATLAVERVISTGSDSNLSQSVWIDGARAWLPQTRSNSANQALLFDTTVFPIVAAIDLPSGLNVAKDRIAIDIADRPSNMPLDLALTSTGKMLVVNAGSDDVSVIRLSQNKAIAHLAAGSNPRGIALSPDERFAYVNNTLSGSVTVIDVAADRVDATIDVTTIPLAANILNGKRLFHTSNRAALAKDRWISCATCHFDGGADGRTWFFRDGPRNTTALFGVGDTLPMHWSGDLDEIQDVENTIRVVQAGSGLASGASFCEPACDLNPPNAGRSQDLDDLAAFMRALPSPPPMPVDGPAASRGAALFAAADCASCHSSPHFTDRAKHDVGTGGGAGERKGSSFDTPSLRGLAETAPYFHDGSAATLPDLLRRHGNAPALTDAQRGDLAEFLRAIPFPQPKRRAAGR